MTAAEVSLLRYMRLLVADPVVPEVECGHEED